jgi:hypothetical protein
MVKWWPNYQERDKEIVDYREFHIRDCPVPFRGPGFDPFAAAQGSFFTCMGAAQTYGCYYEKPYPSLLSESLGLPVLNLGVGGAGPGFYAQFDTLLEAANRGRFVILQCMAARQESNSRFEADGHIEFLRDRKKGDSVTSAIAWRRIVDEEPNDVMRYVAETRANWVESSRRLLERLTVPVIFFWYSRRRREYQIDWAAIEAQARARGQGENLSHFIDGLSGDFPHFVDESSARAVASLCNAEAECLSGRGMGQPLIHRLTGKPVEVDMSTLNVGVPEATHTHNHYYPSQEMHEDAWLALRPVVDALLVGGSDTACTEHGFRP